MIFVTRYFSNLAMILPYLRMLKPFKFNCHQQVILSSYISSIDFQEPNVPYDFWKINIRIARPYTNPIIFCPMLSPPILRRYTGCSSENLLKKIKDYEASNHLKSVRISRLNIDFQRDGRKNNVLITGFNLKLKHINLGRFLPIINQVA